jgi:hypothetical protein
MYILINQKGIIDLQIMLKLLIYYFFQQVDLIFVFYWALTRRHRTSGINIGLGSK